jgi:hypothetical protein
MKQLSLLAFNILRNRLPVPTPYVAFQRAVEDSSRFIVPCTPSLWWLCHQWELLLRSNMRLTPYLKKGGCAHGLLNSTAHPADVVAALNRCLPPVHMAYFGVRHCVLHLRDYGVYSTRCCALPTARPRVQTQQAPLRALALAGTPSENHPEACSNSDRAQCVSVVILLLTFPVVQALFQQGLRTDARTQIQVLRRHFAPLSNGSSEPTFPGVVA